MPNLVYAVPKPRKHHRGQSVVTISGRDIYLGKFGSPAAKQRYDQLIAEWLANGRTLPPPQSGATVVEVAAAYKTFAKTYYVKNGKVTREYGCTVEVLLILDRLYGETHADEFGPLRLQAVRQSMIEAGWTRKYINKQTGRLVRMFKWATARELILPSVYQGLVAVDGLRQGRSAAPDRPPVLPIDDATVFSTIEKLQPTVAAMVQLQRLTGARPDEICAMRCGDVNRAGDIWLYRPGSHKTQHHGRERVIPIGPKAQAILAPYLVRAAESFCFSPAESERKRRELAGDNRTVPVGRGNGPGTNRKHNPKRQARDRYDAGSYRRAIHRACDLAFPAPAEFKDDKAKTAEWQSAHRWSPNRLRHSAATEIRKKFGLESAQVVLGHSQANTTQIYAERDLENAVAVARQIG